MKVLKHLSIFLCSSLLVASSQEYLLDTKLQEFEYDYEKNKAQSNLLKNSWIAPIMLNYSYTRSNATSSDESSQAASVSITQPIFQTGGIVYGIKYAKALKEFGNYTIDLQKTQMKKSVLELLIKLKQIDLKLQKQELLIQNAQLDLDAKQSRYLNGEIDSGFLDNAIIKLNSMTLVRYDLETAKQNLLSSLKTLSKIDYKTFPLPRLKLLTKEEFFQQNILLKMQKAKVKSSSYQKDMIVAKYLPQVALIGSYNWSKIPAPIGGKIEQDYYNYGVSVTLPLNVNSFDDMEAQRVQQFKEKLLLEDNKRELQALYERVEHNLQNLKNKEQLSLQSVAIYKKLLKDTTVLFQSGYKTAADVLMLQNSLTTAKIDKEILELDRDIELLNLYEMVEDEI